MKRMAPGPRVAARGLFFVALVVVGGGVWGLRAQEPFKPGKLSKEEIARLKPGLLLTFRDQGGKEDQRHSRLAALFVPAGAPATPLLKDRSFRAVFQGLLKTNQKGEF